MKTNNIRIYPLVLLMIFMVKVNGFAQSTEAQQLLLNVEKLSQLKNILKDMKKGYTVISTGYNAVKNISQGNFSLHEVFIDGLMLVSPEVRKYRRVADIISDQKDILSEYKMALKRFQSADVFNANEMSYMANVYASLFSQSLDNLDELTMVITANNLRMNDEERLKAIDRIFGDTSDKLSFLRSFNREAGLLMQQRKAAKADLKGMKDLLINN
jgi:hypothetical protein